MSFSHKHIRGDSVFLFQTAVNQANFWGFFDRVGLQVIAKMTDSTVFKSYSVHDFIWGYTDPLLVELLKIKPKAVPTTFFGIFADVSDCFLSVKAASHRKRNQLLTQIQEFLVLTAICKVDRLKQEHILFPIINLWQNVCRSCGKFI